MWTAANPSTDDQNGTRQNNGIFFHSPSGQCSEFPQSISFRRPQRIQPSRSPFRISGGKLTTRSSSYEQKFPQTNNQPLMNVVYSTTTDDCINELSELCPLTSWGLQILTQANPGTQDSALVFFVLPPETRKKRVVWKLNFCWIQELQLSNVFRKLSTRALN